MTLLVPAGMLACWHAVLTCWHAVLTCCAVLTYCAVQLNEEDCTSTAVPLQSQVEAPSTSAPPLDSDDASHSSDTSSTYSSNVSLLPLEGPEDMKPSSSTSLLQVMHFQLSY